MESIRRERQTWHRPVVKRLRAGEAESHAGNTTEGFGPNMS
jgi:hypothetical protein